MKPTLCPTFLICLILVWLTGNNPLQAQTQNTLMEYVMLERPVLAKLLTKAGLSPVLSGEHAYTLLAPPESALAMLEQGPSQQLRTILATHILEGNYTLTDLKDGASVETLAGITVTIFRKRDYTLVNGVRITASDVLVKNGVVHGLEGVIQP